MLRPFILRALKALGRFCGSIKLAMLLLAVVIVASIAGTLVESRFDATVAEAYVYGAPWFFVWLLLLCVNLIGAVVVRYPFKPHQLGFVVTHAGIVVMLAGGIIGRVWGLEGNITLMKGDRPSNLLVVNQLMLEARTADVPEGKRRPLNIALRPPTPERPISVNLNGTKVSVLEHAEELGLTTIVEKSPSGSPALRISMEAPMVAHPVEHWLALNDPGRATVNFGPAIVRFVPESRGEKFVSAGTDSHTHESGSDKACCSAEKKADTDAKVAGEKKLCCPEHATPEVHSVAAETAGASNEPASRHRVYVFSRIPEMTIGQNAVIKAAYDFSTTHDFPQGDRGLLKIEVAGRKFEFPVAALLGKTTPLEDSPWLIDKLEFFADFRMEDKKAVSNSDIPNNPALLFELVGPPLEASMAHGSAGDPHLPAGHPVVAEHQHTHQQAQQPHRLTIFYHPEGQMRYEAVSDRLGNAEGPVVPGEMFGWQDWKFRIEEVLPSAVILDELGRLSDQASRSVGASGALVRITKNGAATTKWITMGAPHQLELGNEKVEVQFGYRLHPLDFSVALEDFVVERNEGTSSPSAFISHVRFTDPEEGAVVRRQVSMNNPANFPNFPGVGLLGVAYKFSQSSWNPDNLQQTTLQVVRDPGWPFKWIGSLMLCGGLFTMFYIKPYPRLSRKTQ